MLFAFHRYRGLMLFRADLFENLRVSCSIVSFDSYIRGFLFAANLSLSLSFILDRIRWKKSSPRVYNNNNNNNRPCSRLLRRRRQTEDELEFYGARFRSAPRRLPGYGGSGESRRKVWQTRRSTRSSAGVS